MNVKVTVDASEVQAALKKLIADAGVITATIYNDVHYVPKLEYGSSRQAPHGMVRVSLREIGNVLAGAMQSAITRDGIIEAGTVREGMVNAVNMTADFGMGLIRDRTPIRTGNARRGWRVTQAK
jgi:hypothetical protein